jgi:hypothetical protein
MKNYDEFLESCIEDVMSHSVETVKKVFPLYTKQSLAIRWGVDRQTVQNWSVRHTDFCQPIEGIVEGGGSYYPAYEVEKYEQIRRLNIAR